MTMDGPDGKHLYEAVPAAGLTVLFDPDEPFLDIVFIHGFTGHPQRTWTHKRGDVRPRNDDHDAGEFVEPPSKVRRLNPFSRSHHGKSDPNPAVYWPRDLIPVTVPYARVLTYGYDTHLRPILGRAANKSTVYDIAWDFLVALEAERRPKPSRPVLFVAHSLGGIIVKEMLRRASGCQSHQTHLHGVFNSTIGIVFFGTPHGGADPRRFPQRIAELLIRAAGISVNEDVVKTLLPSSERLRELRDEFSPMAHQQNWMIHSFQEELGIVYLNGEKVVEDISSCLNFPSTETTQHIGRNHMDMCRFTGFDDIEYKKVAAALDRMAKMVTRQPREAENPSLDEDQRRTLMDSLRFDQVDARQMSIKSAHAKTCRWLLKEAEYLRWLDMDKANEHHGFLWIKGKPGAGKSTLMKFALANSRKLMKDRIVISFFFNARGADLEKSTIGMYRSLLVQLLEQLPELQSVFESVGFAAWNSTSRQTWSIESLKDLFEQAIRRLGQSSVVFFIDALDECDEGEIRDMVAFLHRLGELAMSTHTRFQVLFSSRHYPHITITKSLSLILEGQEGHNQDVTSYVDNALRIGDSSLANQIKAELQEKAFGVFMWVVLVVDMLNKEHDEGRTTRRLQQKLKDIPSDLHKLFRDILTRDCRNRDELLLCIQWLLFTRQPLKPEQLYYAILSGTEPEDLSKWDPDETSMDAIKRFILNSSKGLAEITKSKMPSVQFIHESVRDFLLKENGLRDVWCELGSNFQGESHERLKHCCLKYMNINAIIHLNLEDPLPKAGSQDAAVVRQATDKEFPLLEYAIRNVLYHAEAAEVGGVCQKEFIRGFQLTDWLKFHNLFEKYAIRRHNPKASLLYILAESNMPALIRAHPSNRSCFIVEDERYGPPIFAALATGSDEAVQTFLDVQAEIQPPQSRLHDLCKQYSEDGNKRGKFGRDFTFSRRRSVLSHIVEQGAEVILAFLLNSGNVGAELKGDGPTLLSKAVEKGHEGIVKLLLKTNQIKIDFNDYECRALLSNAVEKDYEGIVKLLLKTSQIEVDYDCRTLLSNAVEEGREGIVKLLLETSQIEADFNDYDGRTLLSNAVGKAYEGIVKLLLKTGQIEADFKDYDGRTLLSKAAENGNEAAVQLFLATNGVDTDSQDNNGRTPLSWAVVNTVYCDIWNVRVKPANSALQDYHMQLLLLEQQNKKRRMMTKHTARLEVVVKLLLEKGADIESKDFNGLTPLSWAAGKGCRAAVKLLMERADVEIDSKDRYGRTPLSRAAENGHEAVVECLLATDRVDINSMDNNGRTPLSWVAATERENGMKYTNFNAVIDLLLADNNIDVNCKDINGRTPLSWAAEEGYLDGVSLLLAKDGVYRDIKDNDGHPALWWAEKNDHEDLVKTLNTRT